MCWGMGSVVWFWGGKGQAQGLALPERKACRPVGEVSRLNVVIDRTIRSAKSREGSRRTPEGYRVFFAQVRGPARKSRLLSRLTFLTEVSGSKDPKGPDRRVARLRWGLILATVVILAGSGSFFWFRPLRAVEEVVWRSVSDQDLNNRVHALSLAFASRRRACGSRPSARNRSPLEPNERLFR